MSIAQASEALANLSVVKDVQSWRRKRLSDAAKKKGGKAALGRALGYKNGAFVGQMLSGMRPVSEKTVEAIEAMHGFAGWSEIM